MPLRIKKDLETQYCATAFIDLQGFSSHLELGLGDVRTHIGQEALRRLETLEKALELVKAERLDVPTEYPSQLHLQRINDALVLTTDLPAILTPRIGELVRDGFSANDLSEYFDGVTEKLKWEEFKKHYETRLSDEVQPLIKFVGLVSRIHHFICKEEDAHHFPGAKSVICSGYRRRFVVGDNEDFLSANFSFSNAYISSEKLKGPKLYLDEIISRHVAINRYARNVLRFGAYLRGPATFDVFEDYEDPISMPGAQIKSSRVEIELFRRKFAFREYLAPALSFLQIIDRITPFLKGRPSAEKLWNAELMNIREGPDGTRSLFAHLPLEDKISALPEMLEGTYTEPKIDFSHWKSIKLPVPSKSSEE